MDLHHIPRYIDSPAQILWWEMDEVIVLLALVCLGIAIDFFFPCLIAGTVLAKAMRRMKEGHQDQVVLQWLHWHGVPFLTLKGAPPGAYRVFIE